MGEGGCGEKEDEGEGGGKFEHVCFSFLSFLSSFLGILLACLLACFGHVGVWFEMNRSSGKV